MATMVMYRVRQKGAGAVGRDDDSYDNVASLPLGLHRSTDPDNIMVNMRALR
jgi:hypothetical protein